MSSAVLGPVFRNLANAMEATIKAFESAIRALRQKIRANLKGKPNDRRRFDDEWQKAKTTKSRLRAAVRALGRLVDDLENLGDAASSELTDAERELWALIDLLRALQGLEDLRDHYDGLAKGMGY